MSMSRMVSKECSICGAHYGYMASGYGVSPSSYSHGATWYHCADCKDKVRWYHHTWWAIKKWASGKYRKLRYGWRFRKLKMPKAHRVYPSLIRHTPLSVQPMSRPVGSIIFMDSKVEDSDVVAMEKES
jgi:hypothetical protein